LSKHSNVDVLISVGSGLYQYIFISQIEKGYVTANKPNKTFDETEILNAFNITSDEDIDIQVSEFSSVSDAINYVTDGSKTAKDVKDVGVKSALKQLKKTESTDKYIVYSGFQF